MGCATQRAVDAAAGLFTQRFWLPRDSDLGAAQACFLHKPSSPYVPHFPIKALGWQERYSGWGLGLVGRSTGVLLRMGCHPATCLSLWPALPLLSNRGRWIVGSLYRVMLRTCMVQMPFMPRLPEPAAPAPAPAREPFSGFSAPPPLRTHHHHFLRCGAHELPTTNKPVPFYIEDSTCSETSAP